MKRILAFALIFTMLFTAMLGIMPAAETDPPALEITRANVELKSTVYLLIEVNYAAAGLESGENVRVDVTNGDKTETLSPVTISGIATDCVGFKYTKLSAKEMGDDLTIRAYCDGVADDTVTYSILEYAIKAKATSDDTAFIELVEAMIDFGAAAQKAFAYTDAADRVLSEDNSEGFGYGLVLCSGTKKIASTADSIAASVPAYTGNKSLYDLAFNAVAADAKVIEGVNRYFYYGADSYAGMGPTPTGLHSSYPGRLVAHTGNMFNLDLDAYEILDAITYNFNGLAKGSLAFDGKRENVNLPEYYYLQTTTGTLDTTNPFSGNTGAPAYSSPGTRPIYLWGFNNSETEGVSATIVQGCLTIQSGVYGEESEVSVHFTNPYLGPVSNWLVDGKMTISISIAIDKTSATRIVGRLTENSTGGSGAAQGLFNINNYGTVDVPSLNATHTASVKDYTQGFTTFHLVLDKPNNKISVYFDDGRVFDIGDTLTADFSSLKAFDLFVRGNAYINQITFSKGDIFN